MEIIAPNNIVVELSDDDVDKMPPPTTVPPKKRAGRNRKNKESDDDSTSLINYKPIKTEKSSLDNNQNKDSISDTEKGSVQVKPVINTLMTKNQISRFHSTHIGDRK